MLSFSTLEACEKSFICGKGGFCNDEKMGFCEFCSDLQGTCSQQKNMTEFGLEQCQEMCEGKYDECTGNPAVSVYAVDKTAYLAACLLLTNLVMIGFSLHEVNIL